MRCTGLPVRLLILLATTFFLGKNSGNRYTIALAAAVDQESERTHQKERTGIPSAVLHNAPTLPVQLQQTKRALDKRLLVLEDTNAAAESNLENKALRNSNVDDQKNDVQVAAEETKDAGEHSSGTISEEEPINEEEPVEPLRKLDDTSWGASAVEDDAPEQSQVQDSTAPEQTKRDQQREESPRLSEHYSLHQADPYLNQNVRDEQPPRAIPPKKPMLSDKMSLPEERNDYVEQKLREIELQSINEEAISNEGHDETVQNLETSEKFLSPDRLEKTSNEEVLSDSEVQRELQSDNSTVHQGEETGPPQSLRQPEVNVALENGKGSYMEEEFDDRTLLDIFAEVAKEYLTQEVIKDTDAECKWDWRSLRCEPACICSFQFLSGDYHLGRSCRRREAELEICEPTVFIQDQQVPKRILSLVRQTSDIVKGKIKRVTRLIVQKTAHRYASVQQNVCADLWSTMHERPEGSCWPLGTVPVPTIPERIFCGRIAFPVCSGPPQREAAPVATTAAAAARKDRRKDRLFTDLYEKDM